MKIKVDEIFNSMDKNNLFSDKSILQSNYRPEEILHRSEQINQIASILAPVLKGDKSSNLFLYGKTGTGKTLSIQYVKDELLKRAIKNKSFKLKIEYLNCKLKKVSDTEYRILAELIKKLVGYQGKLVFDATKLDGAPYKAMDITKAEKIFGTLPKTNLNEGIKNTIEYYNNNF